MANKKIVRKGWRQPRLPPTLWIEAGGTGIETRQPVKVTLMGGDSFFIVPEKIAAKQHRSEGSRKHEDQSIGRREAKHHREI